MDDVVVVVEYRVREGHEATAMPRIAHLVAAVRANEPLCDGIRILQHQDDPRRITLVEVWPDREHYLGPHLQQPHLRTFIDEAASLFEGPPSISFWNASPAWDRRISMRPRD